MSAKTAKVSLTVVVLATAFGVLLYTSLGESMQYYKYADEVMASPAEWQGKNAAGARLRGARIDRAASPTRWSTGSTSSATAR